MSFAWRLLWLAGSVCLAPLWLSAQETNFANGPQYLVPAGADPQFAQPISTPSMAVDGTYPNLQVGASNATAGNIAGAENDTLGMEPEGDLVDLYSVYYGYPPLFLVTNAPEEAEAAPRVTRTGFRRGMGRPMSVADLKFFGYGTTLGEVGRFWKAHPEKAKRVYTNDDLQRLTKAN